MRKGYVIFKFTKRGNEFKKRNRETEYNKEKTFRSGNGYTVREPERAHFIDHLFCARY